MTTFKLAGIGATKILLLPGLMGTNAAFDAMLEFADLERFQYAVMDYRGYGNSLHREGRLTIGEIAADAAALIDSLGWSQLAIAGHSIGALAAQIVAQARTEQVFAIVSIAGMTGSASARDPQRRQFLLDAAGNLATRIDLVDGGSGRQYGAGFARAVASSSWGQIAAKAFAAYSKDAAATDIEHQMAGSALPMLAIVGECDPVNTVERARASTLRWYRRSSLLLLNDIGHYPMIEAPARTITAIENFVDTVADAAAATCGGESTA